LIKAIIFDCFGVVYTDCFGRVYEHFGGDLEHDREFIEQYFFDVSKGNIPSGSTIISDRLGITKTEWAKESDKTSGFNLELLKFIKELKNSIR